MYTKHVTYTDFNGVERAADVHFNLNEMEMVNFVANIRKSGFDLNKMNIPDDKNFGDIIDLVTNLILSAYGEPSSDGMYFRKKDASGQPLYINFVESAVYPALMDSIAESSETIQEFMQGVMPKKLMIQLKTAASTVPAGTLTEEQRKAIESLT